MTARHDNCERTARNNGIDLTSSSIQSPSTSIALKVLCLLVRDEDLEVVEVAFTVIAPWPGKEFFEVGMTALLLAHGIVDNRRSVVNSRDKRIGEKTKANRMCCGSAKGSGESVVDHGDWQCCA